VAGGRLPPIRVVDMRQELARGQRTAISRPLRDRLETVCGRGEQAVLFVPRRGYSPFLNCRSCGEAVMCPHCALALTVHRRHSPGAHHDVLRCHWCNHQQPLQTRCSHCGSKAFKPFGIGTQRVVELLQQQLPGLRLLRYDHDTTRGKDGHRRILEQFARHEADVLVGTQMLAKGMDLPNVTMAVVLAADGLMHRPDLRAQEQALQVFFQLAGRAGRGGVVQATVGRSLSFPEFRALHEASGCTVSWTALLAGIALQDGDADEQLRRSAELVAEGYDVVPQVSPRALKFEYQLKAPFVFEGMRLFRPVSEADAAGKKRLYADPGFRAAVWERLSERVPPPFRRSFQGTVVSEAPGRPELAERSLFEVAEAAGKTPVEYLFDLGLESDLEARFRMPIANHDEDEVERLLLDPNTVVGLSDAGAHASQLCDACATTYLLRRWVRERKSLGLEQAVRMITSRPAEVFGIAERGRLAPGLAADVVVFDPDTVGDGPLRRVYDLPGGADRLISEAEGIEAVIVNGTVIRQGGEDRVDPSGPLPGHLLRNGRPPPPGRGRTSVGAAAAG